MYLELKELKKQANVHRVDIVVVDLHST